MSREIKSAGDLVTWTPKYLIGLTRVLNDPNCSIVCRALWRERPESAVKQCVICIIAHFLSTRGPDFRPWISEIEQIDIARVLLKGRIIEDTMGNPASYLWVRPNESNIH